MLDTQTRVVKNRLLYPLLMVFRPFSPTALSAMGLVMAIICGYLLIQEQYIWGCLFWVLNRFFDGMDGIVARNENKQSDMGGYIDILFDFCAYAIIPICIVLANPSQENWIALAVLQAVFYVNSASWMYLSALLEKRNLGATARGETTSISMPGGIVGGFLTMFIYIGFILTPAWLVWWFWITSILVVIGIVQRLIWAKGVLQ